MVKHIIILNYQTKIIKNEVTVISLLDTKEFPEYYSLFNANDICLTYGGLKDYKGTLWSKFYMLYQCFILQAYGILSVLELYFGSRNLKAIIEPLSALTCYGLATLKSIRYFLRKKEINEILERLENIHVIMLKDYESKQYVDKVENFGKKFITTFLLFGLSNPVLGFIIFITHDLMTNFEKKRLIIQIWLPWSTEETLPYLAANILATLMTVSICAVYTGLDVLDFTYTFQVSTNLKVLQNLLETKGIKDKKFYEMHNVIIELINDYNKVMSGQKYIETLISPIMPCGYGLTFIRTIRRAEETIQYDALSKMACCMAPPLVACCCGQEIITQMERLHEASYMSNWYQENPKVRKDLLTMMIRTTKPSTVNYRMFLTFDHEYLAKVLQAIYSYFMLVINFDED